MTSGSLELTVEATGARPDVDGYEIALTLAADEMILIRPVEPAGGTVTFPDLALGVYLLRVHGLDAHCFVPGGNPRGVTIRAGETRKLVIGIFCPGPGAVVVKTISRGQDIGMGYSVVIHPWLSDTPSKVVAIGTADSLLIREEDLPAAVRWTVRLFGVPENCFPVSGDSRTLRALREATITVEFSVTCIPRSTLIVFAVGGEIFLTSGYSPVNLTNHHATDVGPSLSPDRSRIVFSSNRDEPGAGQDLYLMNVDGTDLLRLTHGPGTFRVGPQAWAPDGSRIVAAMELDGTSELYLVNADGSGMVRLLADSAWNTDPAWSPDGSSIAFCSIRGQEDIHPLDRVSSVFRTGADGAGVVALAMGCDPAWSPDGSRIAITTWDFSFGPLLSVIAGNGAPVHDLRIVEGFAQSGPENPSWSPDGSQIVFERRTGLSVVEYGASGFGPVSPFMPGRSPSWR